MLENLAYADGPTPGFLLLSPTSDRLGTIGETPLVDPSIVHACRKVIGQNRERIDSSEGPYPEEVA